MRQGAMPASATIVIALLTILAPVRGADYYLADERLGMRTAPLLLLSRFDVQADLKMTPEQVGAARRTIDELYTKAEALRGKGDGPEVIRARAALDARQQRWLESALSEPQQARLVQIDLQWEGPSALGRPVIAESLGLTNPQRDAISRAIVQRQRQRDAGKTQPSDEHHLAARALSILNPDQTARWRAMLGEPFVIQTAAKASTPTRRS